MGINSDVVKTLIIIILAYSAIKINAKLPLLYSTLKPETNSDSPSAKSKGVRFVSAKVVIYQLKNIGNTINTGHVDWVDIIMLKLKDMTINKTDSKIRAILTSYEIVWATPRRAPNKAYLEFEAQPAANVVYTLRLETHRKNKALNLTKYLGEECGKIDQRSSANERAKIGAIKKGA